MPTVSILLAATLVLANQALSAMASLALLVLPAPPGKIKQAKQSASFARLALLQVRLSLATVRPRLIASALATLQTLSIQTAMQTSWNATNVDRASTAPPAMSAKAAVPAHVRMASAAMDLALVLPGPSSQTAKTATTAPPPTLARHPISNQALHVMEQARLTHKHAQRVTSVTYRLSKFLRRVRLPPTPSASVRLGMKALLHRPAVLQTFVPTSMNVPARTQTTVTQTPCVSTRLVHTAVCATLGTAATAHTVKTSTNVVRVLILVMITLLARIRKGASRVPAYQATLEMDTAVRHVSRALLGKISRARQPAKHAPLVLLPMRSSTRLALRQRIASVDAALPTLSTPTIMPTYWSAMRVGRGTLAPTARHVPTAANAAAVMTESMVMVCAVAL